MKLLILLSFLLVSCGIKGERGSVGPQGTPGLNGSGCTVEPLSNGALITCGDTQSAIYNGENGKPGIDAIVEIIDPCGKESNYDEVIIRLGNDQLLAHYSDGKEQFLSLIGPGHYVTTDNTKCFFNINNDLTITW